MAYLTSNDRSTPVLEGHTCWVPGCISTVRSGGNSNWVLEGVFIEGYLSAISLIHVVVEWCKIICIVFQLAVI